MRGVKTIEYRSRSTKIIGERFYIYTSRKPGPREEFAAIGCDPSDPGLPTGLIVGSATITHCTKSCDGWEWHLSDVNRLKKPRTVKGHPHVPGAVWFRPFL